MSRRSLPGTFQRRRGRGRGRMRKSTEFTLTVGMRRVWRLSGGYGVQMRVCVSVRGRSARVCVGRGVCLCVAVRVSVTA